MGLPKSNKKGENLPLLPFVGQIKMLSKSNYVPTKTRNAWWQNSMHQVIRILYRALEMLFTKISSETVSLLILTYHLIILINGRLKGAPKKLR